MHQSRPDHLIATQPDCEAYKDFLKAPSPAFVGPRFARSSLGWRPFASTDLTADTQKYAVRALRAAFAWLVDVRYLAGNPWKAVKDPVVVEREVDVDIGRALPASLWHRARREKTRPSPHGDQKSPVWELTGIGKRNKERTVPVSPAAIDALRAHWADRGLEFDTATAGPLVRPVFIPPTPLALARHGDGTDESYVPDGINKMVRWAMKRLVAGMPDLTVAEMTQLASTSPHAFRHTFGTQAGANDVPLDVIQRIMGHASLQTTTIYVQAERERMMKESAEYFMKTLPKSDAQGVGDASAQTTSNVPFPARPDV
ncbi:tyrosine-type recombinase/integrase [Paraburkholderia humisilvae]|uniref:Tyrosine recombinase XerC n=1 Tax=Paraburkholderia humisilvae TaxID=627669 RepID=A0A6J5EZA4_9BURK|nr:tyrosine-type recombinase/integrase [Paraburkholderia humisilvae]CAB3770761.1 Tyrosine recombinase XerC [Paraburkholderia humisilvae]